MFAKRKSSLFKTAKPVLSPGIRLFLTNRWLTIHIHQFNEPKPVYRIKTGFKVTKPVYRITEQIPCHIELLKAVKIVYQIKPFLSDVTLCIADQLGLIR